MLDKEKVKLMTTLAFYEQNEGKEDFKINEYYRKDYVSLIYDPVFSADLNT